VKAAFEDAQAEAAGRTVSVRLVLQNRSRETWLPGSFFVGWQFFDPESERFLLEGEWTGITQPVTPGGQTMVTLSIPFSPEPGGYRVFVSPIDRPDGWAYARGERFFLIDAEVKDGEARVLSSEITTRREMRRRGWRKALPKIFVNPLESIWRNRRLIQSMAQRDILARYRGSLGDAFWTVLNPLLLMATYYFVFGVVLRTRFGADNSRYGYVLYFLAGMLPWLAINEAVGRAPNVIAEHRNFVKKLVFPLETLSVTQTLAALVTECFATLVFLVGLLLIRHAIPATAFWLLAVIVPQILLTLGLCWFLAALGAYVRDLGQVIGFVLTLWFFTTPICYPVASLPASALVILKKNPLFVIVEAYRAALLEGRAPDFGPLWKLWVLSIVIFLIGHAWFYKLRKSFADVI